MDFLFFGNRGSGKTLGAVMEMYLDWLNGYELWTNTPMPQYHKMGWTPKYVDTIDLIQESFVATIPEDNKMRTILIDETHTQADSRSSGSHTNRQLVNFVTQARKRNFRVIYTTQILNGYDVRLRGLTDRVVKCTPIINYNDLGLGNDNYPEPVEFRYSVHIPSEEWRIENQYTLTREFARKLYPLYDTKMPVMPIELIKEKRGIN